VRQDHADPGDRRGAGGGGRADRPRPTAYHPELRREVAYAAQSGAIYLDLSVEENIRYFAAILHARAATWTA
jgi:ABC-type multidrug transport system ATPase subunit